MSVEVPGKEGGVLPRSFVVRFKGDDEDNTEGLQGKGSITVEEDRLVIAARQMASFTMFGRKVEFTFPMSSVLNVAVNSKVVAFTAGPSSVGGKSLRVSVKTRSEAEARDLGRLLGERQSPEFANELDHARGFRRDVEAATPRVYVTAAIVAANIMAWLFMVMSHVDLLRPETSDLLKWGANYGPLVADGEYWRMASSSFIHDGFRHLLVNMWALLLMGHWAERLFGNGFYLWIYGFSGLGSSLASLAWNTEMVSVGASGAILGVYGAMLGYLWRQGGTLPRAIMSRVTTTVVLTCCLPLLQKVLPISIDHAGHAGGFVGGVAMGYLLARPLELELRRAQWNRSILGGTALSALTVIAGWLFLSRAGPNS